MLLCLSLFSFFSRFFFSLLLSLTHEHGSSPPFSLLVCLSLSLSLSLSSSLSLSIYLSISTIHHVLFATTHRLSRYLLPQCHRRLSSPTKTKKNMQHQSKTSSCAENVLFFKRKEKKRKEQPKLHDLAFLLMLRTLLQPELSLYSCSSRSCPFVPLPSKLLSFFTNKIKIKKCSTTRKGPHLPRKLSFQKKKRKEKRDLTTSTSRSFSHCKRCSLGFFLPLQREKREKLPFGPLLASPRFSLQLQDFAAVSMETAALRVQKAKSCSRVTRA